MSTKQKFEIGYQVLPWDISGRIQDSFPFLSKNGIKWFEILLGDSLGSDYARRHLTLGTVGPPIMLSDVDILRRLAMMSRVQNEYNLKLASIYCDGVWTNPKIWPYERDKMEATARFLKGNGARFFVCGGGPRAENNTHSREENIAFARALEEIGGLIKKLGMKLVYHPHLDTFIETREQLDQFLGVVNTDLVGLCIDPAHFQVNGDDPAEIVRTYIDHIHYMHYKDCKGDFENMTGYDRYLSFCKLGAGQVNLPAITETLLEHDFEGLIIIEVDYPETSAEESCEENLSYVKNILGLKLNIHD